MSNGFPESTPECIIITSRKISNDFYLYGTQGTEFSDKYSDILKGKIDPEEYYRTIKRINKASTNIYSIIFYREYMFGCSLLIALIFLIAAFAVGFAVNYLGFLLFLGIALSPLIFMLIISKCRNGMNLSKLRKAIERENTFYYQRKIEILLDFFTNSELFRNF